MTPPHSATGRRRRVFVPRPAVAAVSAAPQDPPIYRDLMRAWADRGRTLPGRQDPEWVRLAAPTVRPGQFSAPRVPPHDGR
nr:hypothetical protein [Streptomyces hygroscopicus]